VCKNLSFELKSFIKSNLRKLKFSVGKNPKIEGNDNRRHFIPQPYKAVLLITADLELAWAWRFSKDLQNVREDPERLARQARKNLPKILTFCDQHEIPVTWLTVGHLFLKECGRNGTPPHPNIWRPSFFENDLWQFVQGDWFDHDPCTNWQDAPEWYAPDLIMRILDSKITHEIGCHTFSHINCLDTNCPPAVFRSDLHACLKAAQSYGIQMESFVHPGHAIGNLTSLQELGFTSYRSDDGNILGYPVRHETGLWELQSTMELAQRVGWSTRYQIHFYQKIIQRAIKHGRVCNLWFHPCVAPAFVEDVIPALFEFIASNRNGIWVATTREYVAWLNETHT